MEAQLQELVPFLHDRNPQVRQIALANLLGQTTKDAPYRHLLFFSSTGGVKENTVIRDLKVLCRDQLATAHDAFRALVNLSDSPLLHTQLSEPPFIKFLLAYIINPQAICADLASMLLSNLTSSSLTCSTVLNMEVEVIPDAPTQRQIYPIQSRSGSCPEPVPYPKGEPKSVLAFPLLVNAFAESVKPVDAQSSGPSRKGELHFLASVFANLTTTPQGRTAFLTPYPADPVKGEGSFEFPLSKCVAFTEHKSLIRRGGVASLLKNCSFNAPAHRALLSPDTTLVRVSPSTPDAPGVDMLPYLLLPLAGPEEYDLDDQELLHSSLQFLPATKQREPDPSLRLTHIETLLLLCTTRWGRETLRSNGTYEVVKTMHLAETVEKIQEHVIRLVALLKRDEAAEVTEDVAVQPGYDEEAEDNLVQEI